MLKIVFLGDGYTSIQDGDDEVVVRQGFETLRDVVELARDQQMSLLFQYLGTDYEAEERAKFRLLDRALANL